MYRDAVNLYPFQNLNDANLFKNDLFAMNARAPLNFAKMPYFTIINSAIYSILTNIFSLSVAIKIVSIILCLSAVTLIYKINNFSCDKNFEFLFPGLFLVYFLSMDSFYGGQARCFGILLFCLFFYFLTREKFFILPFFISLGILFYPYIAVTFTITCFLLPLFFRKKIINKKIYLLLFVINIILSLFLILENVPFRYLIINLSEIGKYKYIANVNLPLNNFNPVKILYFFIFNFNEHSKLYVYFSGFLFLLSTIVLFLNGKTAFRLPKEVLIILLGSVIGFAIIYPLHPVIASRQFVFSMPLFILVFISKNIYSIKRKIVNPTFFLISLVPIFAILHPFFNSTLSYKKYKPLYDYLEKLPKGILIAGPPDSIFLESVPFFSKRNVFFTDRTSQNMLYFYTAEEMQRIKASLVETLFTSSKEKIKEFIQRYNISYFVLENNIYGKPLIDKSAEDTILRDEIKNNPIENKTEILDFNLLDFAKENYDFKIDLDYDETFILNAKKILNERIR